MSFPKCSFCKFNNPGISDQCFDCDMGSNFELKPHMSATETLEWLRLPKDILKQYSVTKHEIQKERKNMKTKDVYALAQGDGFGTLISGHAEIPVRIKHINHKSGVYEISQPEIVCEVLRVTDYTRRNGKSVKKHRSDLIKNVYFNNPVTVVIWTDGSKTIVKANGDEPYDPEKGLAMAIAKKFMGDNETKSNYYDVFKKWLPKPKKDELKSVYTDGMEQIAEGKRKMNDRWKIWLTHIDPKTGEVVGYGVYPTDYATKHNAERRAKQLWGDDDSVCKWIVSQTNPWKKEEK